MKWRKNTPMAFHAVSGDDVATALNVVIGAGLSQREARRRLAEHGYNELTEKKAEHPLRLFLRQFGDFMVLILIGAAVISGLLGEILDAAMIMLIVLLNGILGFVQEYKAERSLAALKELTRAECRVLRDGHIGTIPARELVVGDIVLLAGGSRVPADLRLLEAYDLEAEESILTGESHPTSKKIDALPAESSLAERKCMCYNGTVITRGRGRGIVVATGMRTETGRIADLLHGASDEMTPLQRRLKSLGKWLIFFCLIICAAVTVAGILTGGNGYTMILTGVSLAVASIPEGLPAIVTICLALGVWRLARCRAIVRYLPAVETLGCITCICADKTGTLTQNRMEMQYAYVNDRWLPPSSLTAEGMSGEYSLLVMANCHDVVEEEGRLSGDPTEVALCEAASLAGVPVAGLAKIDEIPFSSQRRLMSVLVKHGREHVSFVKGAPSVVLARATTIMRGDHRIPLTESERKRIEEEVAAYGEKSFRLLALAFRTGVSDKRQAEEKLTFLALTALADPIRADAPAALAKARLAGVDTIMITGDHGPTALAVGRQLGIAGEGNKVVSGADLKNDDHTQLTKKMAGAHIFARVDPEDKIKIVRFLKDRGEVVAMTGDGVNDAPAIKEADIGIAMGSKGTDVAKEAADVVLGDDSFATIVEAVYQGRGIYDNIRKFIRYLLSSNIGEVLTMFLAVLLQLPLPLLPLQILWINLVTDGLPALAVGLDKPSPYLMQEGPRPPRESIFARRLGSMIASRGLIIGFSTIFVYCWALYVYEDIALARTVAFTTLVFSQLFYVFDCRSERESIFSLGFFTNRWLVMAVLISAAMQFAVLYIPQLQQVFATVPLAGEHWLMILLLSFTPTLIAAIRLSIRKNFKKKQEIRVL